MTQPESAWQEQPTPAARRWQERVEAHNTQTRRVQQALGSTAGSHFEGNTSLWEADPRRTGDPILERIARLVSADDTLLDVGGGAGRFALPLALRCRHVTVVEPSAAMLGALSSGAMDAGITNISVVPHTWEEARTEPADVVLCANVLYGPEEIVPFVRKLEESARGRVLVLLSMQSPLSAFSPFWPLVHGEPRIDPPALPDLIEALWEMDIYPDLTMVDAEPQPAAPSLRAALDLLRRALSVRPGSEEDARLETAAHDLLVETPHGVTIPGARPRRQGLLSWQPAPA
ncbi:MAG: class I SAM-dependent methyltransferase [Dehalococcoidia bacterium]